jgi:hypothetical protein
MANAKEESAAKEVRVKPDLSKYVKGVSGSGKKTMRTNDHVAASLDGFTLDEVYRVASELTDTPEKEYRDKYSHLNVGMQRMNLGNRIRGAIAKQDKLREKDKSVANGAKLLEVACEKPRAAANSRAKAAAKKKADAEAKAEAKAKEEKGKSKAA